MKWAQNFKIPGTVELVLVELFWEANQSSKSLAATPLLSPLISLFWLLMEVPCVGNQLNAPIFLPLAPSTNLIRVICVSTFVGYLALSSAGFCRYALGLLFIPASFTSPTRTNKTNILVFQDPMQVSLATLFHVDCMISISLCLVQGRPT